MPTPTASLVAALGALLALAVPAPLGSAVAIPRTARAGGSAATHVLVVSVDGLNPQALRDLGPRRTPVLHRLLRRGAGTLEARTERELTLTLPNHTGMVTGRRVAEDRGGHGVTWNDERRRPATVQAAAGHRVRSVFSNVHAAGRSSAVFASKPKFRLFERSWPAAVDRTVIRPANARLVRLARRDLARRGRAFTFVHLSRPDIVGHARGFMGRAYLDAVAGTDRLVGRLLRTVRRDPGLRGSTAVIVTADHGGDRRHGHDDPARPASYRVPFVVWGAGVARGADLYDLNPDYAAPGTRRTRYSDRRQPVRNGMVANVATDLLGLPAVRGSEHDVAHDLDLR